MLRWERGRGGDEACMLERSQELLAGCWATENGVVGPGTITSDAGTSGQRQCSLLFVQVSIYKPHSTGRRRLGPSMTRSEREKGSRRARGPPK